MPLGWRLARREMFGRKDQFECEDESTSSSFMWAEGTTHRKESKR
jgi:hypothetical protein